MATNKDILQRLECIEGRLPNGELKEIHENVKEIKDILLDPEDGVIVRVNKNTYWRRQLDAEIMIKLKDLLNEGVDFKVTIEDRKGKLIQGGNFTLKSDANLYIKDMIKKHKLRRGKGLWYNEKTGVEMSTNF